MKINGVTIEVGEQIDQLRVVEILTTGARMECSCGRKVTKTLSCIKSLLHRIKYRGARGACSKCLKASSKRVAPVVPRRKAVREVSI